MNRRNFISGLFSIPLGVVAAKLLPKEEVVGFNFYDLHPHAGGTADLWGRDWTPADINAANFGVIHPKVDEYVKQLEKDLEFLWSNYSVQPDFMVVSQDMAESMGFKSIMGIQGPYYDRNYVGSFARSNV